MLKIKIPEQQDQFWDEEKEEFVYRPKLRACELTLEHSLLSISKWESIWCKPFLQDKDKSVEEMLSYLECMVVSPANLDPEILKRIPQSDFEKVNDYINFPATATTIRGSKGKGSSEVITSELIYYWMVALNIPFECQKWHLNRLLTLVRVCEIKNDPKGQKKMTANEIRQDYDKLNEARRRAMHSKG